MRTAQLVDLLAREAGPAPRHRVEMRLIAAVLAGAIASVVVTIVLLGVNVGFADMGGPLVAKLAYMASVLLGAFWFAERISRPGASTRRAAWLLIAVFVAMAVLAAIVLARAPEPERLALLLGSSWASCPLRVAALSLPALAAALWAMRGLAPVRPRAAGFAAGLVAGSVGALGYALYCIELSPPFVLVWYTLGMLIPAAAGALLGARVLRW
jgi:hypothetical protein